MEPKKLCVECKEFLPLSKFKKDRWRTLCQFHYNKRHREAQRQQYERNPRRLQSSTVWQMAFVDAQKVFKKQLAISPSEVRDMMQVYTIDSASGARLVPVDPDKPLSIENYCLTTSDNRREMCSAWKNLKCKNIYLRFMSPELGRQIYASSHSDPPVDTP